MNYTVVESGMICGSYEAEKRIYRKVKDKIGHDWYIPVNQENAAENIYINTHDPNSQGFARRIISFTLEDGTIDKVKGPWNTNSNSLYKNTGIDLRNTYYTFCVVGEDRITNKEGKTEIVNVIYQDEKFVLGNYDRGDIIVQDIANKLNKKVAYYINYNGGSISGFKKPNK